MCWGVAEACVTEGAARGGGWGGQVAQGLVPGPQEEICTFATLRPSAKKILNKFINSLQSNNR